MNGIWKGLLLGILNVFVIAAVMAAIGAADRDLHFSGGRILYFVFMHGSLPGFAVGAALGGLAHALGRQSPLVRLPILTLPALGLVYLLANHYEMVQYAYVSYIPTVVAALILERWTRRPAEPPPVPVARAMS